MPNRPRCPGCGHSCCPLPGLECGGDSDVVRDCAPSDEVCSCGNRFDGDNLCMPSACQWEGIDRG